MTADLPRSLLTARIVCIFCHWRPWYVHIVLTLIITFFAVRRHMLIHVPSNRLAVSGSARWQHWRNLWQEMCRMLQSQTSVVHYCSIIIWQLYQVCCAWQWGTRRGLLCLTLGHRASFAVSDSWIQAEVCCAWQLGTVERCQKPLLQLESNDDDDNDELK